MTLDYALGAIVTVGLLDLSRLRVDPPRAVLRKRPMTINGWIQIALYAVIIIALTKPFGGYMTRVFNGERTLLSPLLRPVERLFYAISGVNEKEDQHWLVYAIAMLAFTMAGLPVAVCAAAAAGGAALQSAGHVRGRRASGLQHLGQFHHQYQLAILCPRNHHELSGADGGSDGAQFPVRRDRHRAGGGADPRLRPPFRPGRRQFLGRCHPLHALYPAAGLHRRRPVLHLAGHAAEPERICRAPRRWKASSR